MGCVSSAFLSHDDPDCTTVGGSTAFAHHIVKLTSTTYGLLTLDPPPLPASSSDDPPSPFPTTTIIPPTPPPRFTLGEGGDPLSSDGDIIISPPLPSISKENSNPNQNLNLPNNKSSKTPPLNPSLVNLSALDEFGKLCCPPNGDNKVVIYTTTLRGIRKTFEDCNAVRSAIQGLGLLICERDISMDRGFREELRELITKLVVNEESPSPTELMIPPRVFIKGRYIGGAEEVLRLAEDGILGNLLSGLPKLRAGHNNLCEGCGGARFLPCFQCNGSCKMVTVAEAEEETDHSSPQRTVVLRQDINFGQAIKETII
ncbi:hypothetical protein ACH5RR_038238 [Cinchona calisaya]|uniref:Glutaredoxin domain-containing protein n=1 Tax=Cinchona calisaya TaxID=153742 RepID=A0ABD2XXY4_9GENT